MAINSLQDLRQQLGMTQSVPAPAQYSDNSQQQPDMQPQQQKSSPGGRINTLQDLRNKLNGVKPDEDEDAGIMDHPLVQALSRVPGYAGDAAASLPGKLLDIAEQVPGAVGKTIAHPINAARDLAGGVARGSQNLAATLGEAGQYIGDNPLTRAINKRIPEWMKVVPQVDIREEMGLGQNNPVDLGGLIESKDPNKLLSGIGQYGLGGAAGGAKLLPMVAANAANMAAQAPPGERLRSATEGAVNAGLPPLVAKGAGAAFNAARPSNLLRGNLSPEELQANVEASQGTNTNLGDVIGSPTLKRIYENVLPNVPMSGAFTKMQQTANQITGKGQDLMTKIGENLPEGDKTQILQTALKKASREASQEKNANYQAVNKIADESGLVVGRGKFQTKAQEILDDIEQSPELKREFPQDLLSDLNSYAKNESGNSLKLSNIFKGKLNDKANDLYISGKKYESGLIKDLRDSLGEDIESSIKESKDTGLKSAYEKAQKEYGSKFAPFEDPDIVKFTRQGGDADLMLSHFLKGGSNDRGNLLQKLTTKLPEGLQELPLHMYLSKAIDESGKLNAPKFRTLYKNLGEKQRDALVPDTAMRAQIEKYVRSVGLNSDTFNTMFNPKTGQRNLDSAIGALEGMMAYTHPVKAAAGIALGRGATKLLTSEKLREGLVKAMLKQKK